MNRTSSSPGSARRSGLEASQFGTRCSGDACEGSAVALLDSLHRIRSSAGRAKACLRSRSTGSSFAPAQFPSFEEAVQDAGRRVAASSKAIYTIFDPAGRHVATVSNLRIDARFTKQR